MDLTKCKQENYELTAKSIRFKESDFLFLLSVTIWQTGIYDFSSNYNMCGPSLNNTCITDCSLAQYYDSYKILVQVVTLAACMDVDNRELATNV